jgi:diguanylate cyclase (GGDEF)-like protein/PAS domain S-box-containing protein
MEKELRILMIEDVPTDAELEIRELKRAGLRVTHRIVDTEEAFRLALREFQPEIILSDFSMPQFDGMVALALVRELAPEVPFIFVSGTIGEEYAIRALKNGATDYVLKNNLVRLSAAVERALRDAHDTAERRRAEAQLHLQGTALDAAANAIMITRQDGTIRWVNRAFSTLSGYSAEEAIGKNPRMLKSGQHGPEFYRRMFDTILGGSMWQGEIVNRYKDGRLATEEMTITPVRGQGGDITDFIAIKQDITARKEAEKHRARLSAILEASPDFVATADPNRKVLYFNSAARRLLELPENIDPSKVRIGDTHPPWAAELVLKTGIPTAIRDGVWSGETAFLTLGGREVPVIQVILAHKGADGSVEFLSTIARDIGERKSQELRIARLSRIHAVLSGINSAIVRIRDREELFSEACRIAVEHGGFGLAWIGLFDPATLDVTPVAWAGLGSDKLKRSKSTARADMPQGQGLVGQTIRGRKLAFSNDISVGPKVGSKRREEALRLGYRSLIVLPLFLEDAVAGILALFAKEPNFFDDEEIRLLTELAGDVSFALDHIAKEQKLEYLSYYDALTGLPNRTLFNDRLEQRVSAARQDHKIFAVMMLDLERFRNINQTFGQQAGDELLRQVGQRLKNALEETGILARIGANHFAVATQRADEGGNIGHLLENILTAVFGQPFEAGGNELRLPARVGVAIYPEDGTGAESLLKNAEAALNKAKASRERYLFYQPKMNAAVAQNLLLENKLRQALEKEQFVLHYQPKVDLANGTLVGLEALIRWNDPETGLVPPMRFIPLLEETGMILDAGRWAIRKVLEDYREWRARGLQPPHIAVNVSSVQLSQKNFVDVVRDAIGESPAGSPALDLEITESLIMEDIEVNIEKLRAVRDMGVNIAIDDFGTGYSSLGYLAKLPVNALKIDRSFIMTMANNADSMTIVSTIISLAHSLNLKVIAEGVETQEQAKFLKLLKCDEMQGYFFSKPLPAEEMTEMLRSGCGLDAAHGSPSQQLL